MPSAPIDQARKQVIETDFFALCHLMMCQLSYAGEHEGSEAEKRIRERLPGLPTPQGTIAGRWRRAWGPKASPNNGNLMFAAEFLTLDTNEAVFSVIVVRGTDVEASPSGVFIQIIEDFDAGAQVPFPGGNTVGAKIAAGTHQGLGVLTTLTDPESGVTLEQYARNFAIGNRGAPIVITGHSLGGCETTVLAAYLASIADPQRQIPASSAIVPVTFAAPTAGNQAFIDLFEQTFPAARRWFNPNDLVPKGFAQLEEIEGLWSQCGRPLPLALKAALFAYRGILKIRGASYAQQPLNVSRALKCDCQPKDAAFLQGFELKAETEALLNSLHRRITFLDHPIPGIPGVDDFIDWFKELLYQHMIYTGYWTPVGGWAGVAQVPWKFSTRAVGKDI